MNLVTYLKTTIKALSQYTLYIWYPQLMHILNIITIYLLNTCQIMALRAARRNHSVITELLPISSPHPHCMYV